MSKKEEVQELENPFDRNLLTRRGFLQGVGALSLAGMLPTGLLMAEEEVVGEKPASHLGAYRPRIGALFNPYHEAGDWNDRTVRRPEGRPVLGAYDGAAPGTLQTQLLWAQRMGLSFLLSAYAFGRSQKGVDALFEAAPGAQASIALLVDVGDGVGRARFLPPAARLARAVAEVQQRYVDHPAYLRTRGGQPILFVTGLEDRAVVTGNVGSWGAVLHLPAGWRGKPRSADEARRIENLRSRDAYVGYSLSGDSEGYRRIPGVGVSASLVALTRNGRSGLGLPESPVVRTGQDDLIVLDSFNHWGVSVPLEPGTRSGQLYLDQVRAWSRSRQG